MKLVRIDLNTQKIRFQEITQDSQYYLLGARGLTSQLILNEVPPTCDPLEPNNKLIISNGILAGTPFPNSARSSIGGKSPLTNGIKEANVGGRPAMLLARRGIRALILEKKSENLKILLINDDGIKLIPGIDYQGLGNYELHSQLLKKFGANIGIYSIGPAGEYLMRSASVAANDLEGFPSRHAARGGLGAVMGSKGIKAIVIQPPKGNLTKIHNLKKFREVSKPLTQNLVETKQVFSTFGTPLMMRPMNEYGGIPTQNFRRGSFDKIQNITGEKLHELITTRGGKNRLACCPTCVIKCSNYVVDEKGNHITSSLEYETMALNGTNLMIDNLDSLAKIDHLCDDVGIDTIEFGVTIGVAMDNDQIAWGDSNRVFEILDKEIRNNTEKGQNYGNGVKYLGRILNTNRIPEVKGQGISAYDCRVFKAMGVTYATSPMGADHTSGAAIAGRVSSQHKDYGELTKDDRKLDLSFELQIYTAVMDSMGLCYFVGPSYENMEVIASAINAMYDLHLTRQDIIDIGRKILKNEIQFNESAGISQDMNDVPKFFREEHSNPLNLKYSFSKEDLRSFWNRLDNYNF